MTASSSSQSNMEQYYNQHIRPLESDEFIDWFDAWYSDGTQYTRGELYDTYLSERRFALIGWLAARTEADSRNNPDRFNIERLGIYKSYSQTPADR